jgi:hypothetical protein
MVCNRSSMTPNSESPGPQKQVTLTGKVIVASKLFFMTDADDKADTKADTKAESHRSQPRYLGYYKPMRQRGPSMVLAASRVSCVENRVTM